MPDGVAKRPDVRPRLAWCKLVDDTFQLFGCFRNPQQATLDCIAHKPVFNEISETTAPLCTEISSRYSQEYH